MISKANVVCSHKGAADDDLSCTQVRVVADTICYPLGEIFVVNFSSRTQSTVPIVGSDKLNVTCMTDDGLRV